MKCPYASMMYDVTKVLGYVDLGAGITDNSPPKHLMCTRQFL